MLMLSVYTRAAPWFSKWYGEDALKISGRFEKVRDLVSFINLLLLSLFLTGYYNREIKNLQHVDALILKMYFIIR